MTGRHDFLELPDLASRALAGSVIAANDELFAERENLIKPGPPDARPRTSATRARSTTAGRPDAGASRGTTGPWSASESRAIVRGVVIDTSHFTGNYPPEASVEGAAVDGYPAPGDIVDWVPLLARTRLAGDSSNAFAVSSEDRVTHVRLSIYPDGGVARFRVHGEGRPDRRLLTGTIDLAAIENGGLILDCSNRFYSSPTNILLPGRARTMGDGWENARRRDTGNDHVTVKLAGRGRVRRIEIDTSYFVGNAPAWARVTGDSGVELVARVALQPDTRHHFVVENTSPVDTVRLDVYPDGGIARLRVWGELAALGGLG